MPYQAAHPVKCRVFYLAWSCPYLVDGTRCAGGDYCDFPPGHSRLCCAYCPLFDACPDRTGICGRLEID